MSNLGVNLLSNTNQVNKQKLDIIQNQCRIKFPKEYRDFILNFDEIPFENEITFSSMKHSSTLNDKPAYVLDAFFGLNGNDSILEQINCYVERMPDSLIPIGECPGGNLICLGVAEHVLGRVYFWDHENEYQAKLMLDNKELPKSVNEYWDNLHLVSNTFLEFIKNLKVSDTTKQSFDLDDVEIWLDEDLLND